MREATISLPRLGLIAATRGLLGLGIGLLLSERLGRKERFYAGWALVAVGALSTVPLAIGTVKRIRKERMNGRSEHHVEVEGIPAD
jgi:hypothetical protein